MTHVLIGVVVVAALAAFAYSRLGGKTPEQKVSALEGKIAAIKAKAEKVKAQLK